jgi:hypothetical protein
MLLFLQAISSRREGLSTSSRRAGRTRIDHGEKVDALSILPCVLLAGPYIRTCRSLCAAAVAKGGATAPASPTVTSLRGMGASSLTWEGGAKAGWKEEKRVSGAKMEAGGAERGMVDGGGGQPVHQDDCALHQAKRPSHESPPPSPSLLPARPPSLPTYLPGRPGPPLRGNWARRR